MENKIESSVPVPTSRFAIKWGIISGFIFIIYTLIINITGLTFNQTMQWIGIPISLLITGGCMFMGMGEFKNENSGFMTYGQGISLGAIMSAISGALVGVFSVIYNTFIDPGMMKRGMDMQKEKIYEQWEKQGLSESQMETAWEQTQKFTGIFQNPGITFAITVVSSVIIGLLIALIVAAIQKKDKPLFQ